MVNAALFLSRDVDQQASRWVPQHVHLRADLLDHRAGNRKVLLKQNGHGASEYGTGTSRMVGRYATRPNKTT